MQEREDKDSGFYTNKALEEISNDLVSFIENNDSRPQCKLINKEYGIVNYLLNNFRITTMTYCEKEKFRIKRKYIKECDFVHDGRRSCAGRND